MSEELLARTPPEADLRIPYGPDPNQFGEWRVPSGPGPHPVIIVIHGGYWRTRFDLTHMSHLAETFRQNGYATWNLEYRRVGQPGGGWPGTVGDIEGGCDFVLQRLAKQYPLDERRIAAVGFSAGGHLALYAAAWHPEWRGVVSLAGVADLAHAHTLGLSNGAVAEFLGDCAHELLNASPMEMRVSIPQRLIHGHRDEAVPFEISERYRTHKEKQGEDVQLWELPEASHFDLIDPLSPHWSVTELVVEDLLR